MGKGSPSKLQQGGIYPYTKRDGHYRPLEEADILELVSEFQNLDELIDAAMEDLKEAPFHRKAANLQRIKARISDFCFTVLYACGPLAVFTIAQAASLEPDYERDPVYQSFVNALFFLAIIIAAKFEDFSPNFQYGLARRVLTTHFRKRSATVLVGTDTPKEKTEQ